MREGEPCLRILERQRYGRGDRMLLHHRTLALPSDLLGFISTVAFGQNVGQFGWFRFDVVPAVREAQVVEAFDWISDEICPVIYGSQRVHTSIYDAVTLYCNLIQSR